MRRVLVALTVAAVAAAGYAGYAVAASSSDLSASCDPPSYDGMNLNLHCVVPQATATVTQTDTTTETATVTETATATVTTTETQTQTETATVTQTVTAPPAPWTAPGQAMNAVNTGYVGDGVTADELTPVPGTVTYDSTFNGQTITRKAYTGRVNVTGSNITIKDCSLTFGGLNSIGFNLRGNNDTIDHCTITAPPGQSLYEPIWLFGDHNFATANDISRGENLLTTYGTNAVITRNYLHDVALDSNPADHADGIEVYGGGPTLIRDNRIEEDWPRNAPINVAPYNAYTVTGLTIEGNFIDDGQSDVLLASLNPNHLIDGLTNTRILGNAFGGHQCPASDPNCFHIFHPTLNYHNRAPFVETETDLAANPNAMLFPTTGPDVNRWAESNDIATPSTPHDGDIVIPS